MTLVLYNRQIIVNYNGLFPILIGIIGLIQPFFMCLIFLISALICMKLG